MAPLILCVIPFAAIPVILYTLFVLCFAMKSLHKVPWWGLVFGVFMPLFSMQFLWGAQVVPLAAPVVADAFLARPEIGEGAKKSDQKAKAETPALPGAEEAFVDDETPPLPDPNRSHKVELFKEEGALYSERYYKPQKNVFLIVHKAIDDKSSAKVQKVIVQMKHIRGPAYANAFIEVPLDVPLASRQVRIDGEPFTLAEEVKNPWAVRALLREGEVFSLEFSVHSDDAEALLQHGPSVGRYHR